MDIEVIKALASVPVELVLIYIIVQQQKQQILLVRALCELRNRIQNIPGSGDQSRGGLDDNQG